MTGVDVSGLRAGQRVRVTFEGELANGGDEQELSTQGVYVRLYDGDRPFGLVAVEVLPEPSPAWLSTPGEAVRETRTGFVWVCDAYKWWRRAGSEHGVSDKTMAQQIAAGLVVHLVPEATP